MASTALVAVLASLTASAAAEPDAFTGLGTLGGNHSYANGMSADGAIVVGSADTGGAEQHAFRWSGGTMTDLGTLGGTHSVAKAVSADGAVVVGSAYTAGNAAQHAFRWSGGTMTDLGTLGGTNSAARAVSADGAVVVGSAATAGDAAQRAFRWSGGTMTDLGTLGGTYSAARAVSADGAVVVGSAAMAGDAEQHAFRWSGGTMTDLGTLGGWYSYANGVSADGAVVVGSALRGDGAQHAFRWSGGTMTDLGTLGGTHSTANAVSADGSVAVGSSYLPGNTVQAPFRWKASTGMQSIPALLMASGVNLTGWQLSDATGVSADGTVIVGDGTNPSGFNEAWLARFSAQFGNGVITPGVVARSFAGQSALGQTANAALGGTLGTMNEYATQAQQTQGNRSTPFSVFGYAAYDSDPVASGTLGMTMDLSRDIVVGATIGANYLKTDMVFNGSSRMSGGSAGAFIARVPDAGLQWLTGIGGTTMKGDVTRGYLNGSGPASSTGNTSARGVGATARLGWTFNDRVTKTQLTPFVSYTVATTSFDGYTETGGPFPARFEGFTSTAQTSRVGADARYTFKPGTWVWGTAAWAHRLDGGKNPDISGTLIGLFAMTAPGVASAPDWAEVGGGVRLPVWNNGAITASVTASLTPNQTTTYVSRLGISQVF